LRDNPWNFLCRRFEERPWNTKPYNLKSFRRNPSCWKWVVFLDATKTRTGIALTRADAVLDAEFAIEKALESRQPASSNSRFSAAPTISKPA